MELDPVINAVASQADDFLAGIADRKEARAAIAELIAADHPQLAPRERQQVANAVMAILEAEDFFTTDPGASADGIDAAPKPE